MDRRKRPSPSGLFSAAALAVIAFLALTTVYSSDDFSYSTYFDNGFSGYLPLMVQHYTTMNGRALVHLAAHLILHFGNVCFCLVCLGTCILIPLCTSQHRACGATLCLFLSFFLAMPRGLMNQGVMWISAFCNYMLPCAMLCGLLALLFHPNANRPRMAAAVVLSLLCGATTEQSGAMALAAVALYIACSLRDRKPRLLHGLACLACAAVGYGTIFLSPSTQRRFLEETKAEEASSFLTSLLHGLRKEGALMRESILFPQLLTVLFLACGYCLYRRSGRRVWAIASSLGIVAAWGGYFLSGEAAVVLFLFALVVLGGLLLIWHRMELPGILMICAAASACIMLPTNSIDHRSLLPLYLLLSAATAVLAARSLTRTKVRTTVLALAFLAGAACILPSISGYWHNLRIDQRNRQHLEEYRQTGTLRYCMDYDLDYTWIKPYHDGVFHLAYLDANGLSRSTDIYYYSSSHPAVYLDGKLLSFPAIELPEGEALLPLRAVVEGLGGTVEAVGYQVLVTLNGQTCQISRATEYAGVTTVTWTDPQGAEHSATYRCSTRMVRFCVAQEMLESFFGITVIRDDAGVQISSCAE